MWSGFLSYLFVKHNSSDKGQVLQIVLTNVGSDTSFAKLTLANEEIDQCKLNLVRVREWRGGKKN